MTERCERKSRAARATKRTRSKTYHNFIGGRWVPSQSGEWLENKNPADTRDLVGRFPLSISDDVSAAVAAAVLAGIEALERAGAVVSQVTIPHTEVARSANKISARACWRRWKRCSRR